jgi:hypothetical protein
MLRCCLTLRILLLSAPIFLAPAVCRAQLVPGTGTLVNQDDLEDSSFVYNHNWPKSSKEEDEQIRYPLGSSSNGMWSESPKRGAPDAVKWIETPAGGLAGSKGALYLRSRDTGVPGQPRYKQTQDDFIMRAKPMSVAYSPSCVVRVYLPEWDQWEQRNGVSFGLRAGMQGPQEKQMSTPRRLFKKMRNESMMEIEPYYPGFFIHFVPGNDPMNKTGKPYAILLLRADEMGHEIQGPIMDKTGWWTLGMSVTPDARTHFYAHPGVADLTQADYIRSSLPYGIRGTFFNTIFFNVCSGDDGKTWSTPWIIDDPRIYYAGSNGMQHAFR